MAKRRAVVIRGGEWDATQAGPRARGVLQGLGFEVDALGWDMSGKRPKREPLAGGGEVRRFRRYIPPRSVHYFLTWPIWWAWLVWHLLHGRYELVHTMNVETLVPTLIAKLLGGCRLVYDVRDPLGMALSNVRWPVPQAFRLLDRLLAPMTDGILLSQGDVGACAEFFGRAAARRVPVVQVLNVPHEQPPPHYRKPTGRPLRINYSGFISPGRGASELIQAVSGREDVVVDVVGQIRHDDLRREFEAMPNATVYGLVPFARAMGLLDQSDVVMILYDDALATTRVCSANKMFEAMMYGKPYLATKGGWPGKVASRFGLGWEVPYGDARALGRMLDELAAEPARLVEAGRRGRECLESLFAWPRHRENMLRLYRHVLWEGQPERPRPCQGWMRFIGTRVSLEDLSA